MRPTRVRRSWRAPRDVERTNRVPVTDPPAGAAREGTVGRPAPASRDPERALGHSRSSCSAPCRTVRAGVRGPRAPSRSAWRRTRTSGGRLDCVTPSVHSRPGHVTLVAQHRVWLPKRPRQKHAVVARGVSECVRASPVPRRMVVGFSACPPFSAQANPRKAKPEAAP